MIMVGVLGIIFLIIITKNRMQVLINVLVKSTMHGAIIYFINYLLITQGVGMGIGINLLNLVVSSVLGMPGIVLLYTIHFTI